MANNAVIQNSLGFKRAPSRRKGEISYNGKKLHWPY